MDLSIIISAYSLDRYSDLIDLLDGIHKQSFESFEVILIIDENIHLYNKIQDYAQLNKFNKITVIFNPENKGLSYSRNIGIDHSKGKILAFIDDDAIPDVDWAKLIVETFDSDECVGAVTGDIIPLWKNEKMAWFPRELHWMISCSYVMTPKIKQEVERGFGVNMAFRKYIFDTVGVFDTNFGINGKKWVGGEDTDMFLRVKKIGMKVIFHPEARVQHKVYDNRIKTRNVLKRAFNGGYSVALMKYRIKYNISNSTESNYLKHLLYNFYSNKLIALLKKPSFIHMKQILAVSGVLIFETIGYVYGTFETN